MKTRARFLTFTFIKGNSEDVTGTNDTTALNSNLIPFVEEILDELKNQQIKVVLASNESFKERRDGARIRVAVRKNPEWYRALCANHPPKNWKRMYYEAKRKKPRTIIKRAHIYHVLKCMIKNGKSNSQYAPYIIKEAQRRADNYNLPVDQVDWKQQIYT